MTLYCLESIIYTKWEINTRTVWIKVFVTCFYLRNFFNENQKAIWSDTKLCLINLSRKMIVHKEERLVVFKYCTINSLHNCLDSKFHRKNLRIPCLFVNMTLLIIKYESFSCSVFLILFCCFVFAVVVWKIFTDIINEFIAFLKLSFLTTSLQKSSLFFFSNNIHTEWISISFIIRIFPAEMPWIIVIKIIENNPSKMLP